MITEKLLTKNKYSRIGKSLKKTWGIVVHYVGVPNQKAEQIVAYFESLKEGTNGIYASAHYVIGTDGNGINCIPDNEVAYHCGARVYKPGITDRLGNYPNYTTIGIEMCHTDKGFTEETLETASKLVAQLLAEHDLGVENLYRHFDITGKICPKFFVEDEAKWTAFKARVNEKLC
jgi:N-acetylmuramoyl-L-alanine amidase